MEVFSKYIRAADLAQRTADEWVRSGKPRKGPVERHRARLAGRMDRARELAVSLARRSFGALWEATRKAAIEAETATWDPTWSGEGLAGAHRSAAAWEAAEEEADAAALNAALRAT